MKSKKEIGFIGHIDLGSTCVAHRLIQIADSNSAIYVVMSDNIIIDGVEYEKIAVDALKKIEDLAMIAFNTSHDRKLNENVNIEDEFRLIKAKRSKLSAWERKEVERIFFTKYKEISLNKNI